MTTHTIHLIAAALLLAITAVSCGDEDIHGGKTPIARVYDSYLYYEDLGDLVPKGMSPDDSAHLVKQYSQVWAKQQLMIKKAELNLTPEQMDVQKQLDEYRNNLLTYKYKDAFVKANLDTVVTQEQIVEYYHSHPEDFILNTPAVRCIFMQVLDAPEDVYNAQRLLNFHSEKDSLALLEFSRDKATKFENFNNRWETLAQASRQMPTAVSEKDIALKVHGIIRVSEGTYIPPQNPRLQGRRRRDAIRNGGAVHLDDTAQQAQNRNHQQVGTEHLRQRTPKQKPRILFA